MRFFDAHNHLHDERLSPWRDSILTGLGSENIEAMVVNGSCEEDWPAVLELARRETRVIPSFGYHPWYVGEATPGWRDTFLEMLDACPSAVGEIGLDRYIPDYDTAKQEELFAEQMRIAVARELPVSIHCLKAWGRLAELLQELPRPRCGIVLHSFGGPAEMVPLFDKLGAYFSFPGYFLGQDKERKRAVFRAIPRERILVETDAPDQCLPLELDRYDCTDPATGKRLNHPFNLQAVYRGLATALEMDTNELMEIVRHNFLQVFGKVYRRSLSDG